MSVLKVSGLPPCCRSFDYLGGGPRQLQLGVLHPSTPLALGKTLKRVEAQLPGFVRVHKSALINPVHVTILTTTGPRGRCIHLSNGAKLLVTRRRREQMRHQLTWRSE